MWKDLFKRFYQVILCTTFWKKNIWPSPLSPCHIKPRFHCHGPEMFKFPEDREIASKSWLFCGKGPIMASLQPPWHCYRARMVFYPVPTEFLLAILCILRHFHCAFTVLAMLALRFHNVLKTQCRSFPNFPNFWLKTCRIWENSICAISRVYLFFLNKQDLHKNNKLSV